MKNKIEGICNLCGNLTKLVKAHIIPESFYKYIYDEDHLMIEVSLGDSGEADKKRRKGIYDANILCSECDNEILGKRYDDYGAKVFLGYHNLDLNIVDHRSKHDPRVMWRTAKSVDSGRVKLFLLSILWRAHISQLEIFKSVNLGPHADAIKKMIANDAPGDWRNYPIVVLHYTVGDQSAGNIMSVIRRYHRGGKTYYAMLLTGVLVIWFISENAIPALFEEFVIGRNGDLSILYSPTQGYNFVADFLGDEAFRYL